MNVTVFLCALLFFKIITSKELAIGIVTVTRRNNEDYLLRTLNAIQREADAYSTDTTHILKSVMVLHPRSTDVEHRIFNDAKRQFKSKNKFSFFTNDVLDTSMKDVEGLVRVMTTKDRQQNMDVAALLDTMHKSFCKTSPNGYVLVMEDDFELCPFAFQHYNRILHSAEQYFPNFMAIRTTVGFSGIIFHCHDVPFYRDFIRVHNGTLPPDTLMARGWSRQMADFNAYMGPNRQQANYRHNLMEHLGRVSNIPESGKRSDRIFPGCFDSLHFVSLLEDCPGCYDDHANCVTKEFSPCTNPNMGPSILTTVRASAEYDPRFMIQDPKVDTIKIVSGDWGEDCNQVCQKIDMKCQRYMLPIINKCSVLHEHFGCGICVDHPYDFPEKAGRNPGYEKLSVGICFESVVLDKLSCEKNDVQHFKRLCPCGASRGADSSGHSAPKVLTVVVFLIVVLVIVFMFRSRSSLGYNKDVNK
jgi:hypothetical protein